ncbi:hypothetical protein FRC14_006186 [Serendipita sp. 396]|nr:hypothetical protein FRC14_006186 [Serendipita sp. 396]KAG8778884.1 hypothetical protein FRC15_010499 [Serendipita sp. 397]KAG8796748.1 hypothetical protein FRC16_009508 [Serendipita sp. 398]KAG8831234.1 hypothetical protein FRC18_006932 [Serendipita sp. 400]KAG8865091.1 hypothetical protein FRC20_009887 [Serendipita sp. 405]
MSKHRIEYIYIHPASSSEDPIPPPPTSPRQRGGTNRRWDWIETCTTPLIRIGNVKLKFDPRQDGSITVTSATNPPLKLLSSVPTGASSLRPCTSLFLSRQSAKCVTERP